MAPFMQLMMDTEGNHSPCSVLDGLWHMKNDVWNHEALEKLRDNHAKGIRDKTCESCWTNEETGIESYRQRYHASNKFDKENSTRVGENLSIWCLLYNYVSGNKDYERFNNLMNQLREEKN